MKPLRCPACRADLAIPHALTGGHAIACPACHDALEVDLFPALWRTREIAHAGAPVTGDEAPCYVHGERRAEAACDRCGRFMCALCEVRVGEQHLCIACLDAGQKGRTLPQIERGRTIPVAIGMRLVVFGLFLGPVAPLVCLPGVGLAVWGWFKPTSVTGRRYGGMATLAIIGGLVQTFFWTAFWMNAVMDL